MRLGILDPLYKLVAWVIREIYALLSPLLGTSSGLTWVLTIVILVMLMRLLLVPLFIKQMHSMRAMTALAPKAQELRKKYKNDKQRLNDETMKMYREAGVNPLMGCLPLVLQLPIFFALFGVLRVIASPKITGNTYGLSVTLIRDAQKAKIFGATIADKFLFQHPAPHLQARLVILGTVVISMLTTYLTMRQNVKRGMMPSAQGGGTMGQQQKLMMYIMPFFALTGLYWPFGLVLYWVTTNVWTLGQQFVLLRKYPVGAAILPTTGTGPATGTGGTAIGGRGPSAGGIGGAARRAITGGPGASSTGSTGAGKPGTPSTGANGAVRKPVRGSSSGAGKSAGTPGANGSASGKGRDAAAPAPRPAKMQYNTSPNGGGLLRRFTRARAAAVPETGPERPVVKPVRQQRQRQPRSKRTGNK